MVAAMAVAGAMMVGMAATTADLAGEALDRAMAADAAAIAVTEIAARAAMVVIKGIEDKCTALIVR